MIKYTINNVFDKTFDQPIWKIEVDCINNNLAIECRDPESTIPTFSICSFDGEILMKDYTIEEKEWTLEGIQGNSLILKKFGSSSPIQAGIQIIHFPTKTIITTLSEYILKEIRENIIIAVHRSIPSGLLFYINLKTGEVSSTKQEPNFYYTCVEAPRPYLGKIPPFMKDIQYEDQLFIQAFDDHFLWTYQTKNNCKFDLFLLLSTKNEILDKKVIIKSLDKLILQPYFKVKNYIFFLSDTKQNIVTYLV